MTKKRHFSLQKWQIGFVAFFVVFVAIFINSRMPRTQELGFSRNLLNPNEFNGNIPGVFNTTISHTNDHVEVAIKRGDTSLTFQHPIEGTTITEKKNLLSFVSPNETITTEYQLMNDGIKENIILNKIPSENIFPSTLKTQGLITRMSSEGVPIFYDKTNTYQYHFERPFVKDAKGAVSYAVKYKMGTQSQDVEDAKKFQFEKKLLAESQTINQTSDSYTLLVEVDSAWLHDPKRVLPIIIDPTVVHNTSSTFATGTLNNVTDTGSGASPVLQGYYQEHLPDAYTTGLWHMNEASGNILDTSGNSNTGVPTGTTVVAGILGNGRSFNGTSDYIEIADSGTIRLGSPYFSFLTWINPGTITGCGADGAPVCIIANKENSYEFAISNTGTVHYAIRNVSPGWAWINTGAVTPANTWSHLALTYDGANFKAYVNGTLIGSTVATGPIDNTTYQNALRIGARGAPAAATSFFPGKLDEMKFSSTILSPEEINANASRSLSSTYTSPVIDLGIKVTTWNSFTWSESGIATGYGETPYSSTGLVAQWNLNDRGGVTAVADLGTCGASCNGTLTGFSNTTSPDVVSESGWTTLNQRWGAGAVMLNGSTDYISIPDNSGLSFGNGATDSPFSMSAWVKANTLDGTNGNWIINKRDAATNDEYQIAFWQKKISVALFSSNSNYIGKQTLSTWQTGQWYHIVVTYDGSKTTAGIKIYVNGTLQQTVDASAGTYAGMNNGTQPVIIGKPGWTSSLFFDGVIDSTSIYSRALSVNEILSNYNSSNLEFQTRSGNTTDPNDGTWEAWKPSTGEATLNNLDAYSLTGCTATGGTTTDGGRTYTFTQGERAVYYSTGVDQTYTVPAGVTSIRVKMWGAGGGGGAPGGWTYGYAGGAGGYTTGTIAVTPGQVLTVMAGAGGVSGVLGNESTTNSYGGGGKNCNSTDCRYSGQGGGRSAIRSGGVDLLTAGGGGGGGATATTVSDSSGGAGGGSSGIVGVAASSPLAAGGGGTQGAGGAAGNGNLQAGGAGSQYTGGFVTGGSYGGGGGGGWYGGGSGSYHNVTVSQMGGGGGGSGYIGGAGVSAASTTAGSGVTPGNSSDDDNIGAGKGGPASSNGSGGLVIIAPVIPMSFTCTSSGNVDVLVVAGGGGGGSNMGGGGGGGGVLYRQAYPIVANTPISVTVGYGGIGAPPGLNNTHPLARGSDGGNSVFGTLTAIGGGWGGTSYNSLGFGIVQGGDGGSGGGSSGYNNNAAVNGFYGSGNGTPGQGYRGGFQGVAYYSGGGGGAGGPGADGNYQANGGIGFYSDILGTGYYWGGGGGGGGYSVTGGNGGAGGGGGGAVGFTIGGSGLNPGFPGGGGNVSSQTNMPGGNAGANTGGGGGGGSHYFTNNKGGDGGTGIVIVRLSRQTTDTIIKVQGAGSQKITTGKTSADSGTLGLWHLDETGGTGAYLKNSGSYKTTVYSYTGSDQTYTVPAGVTSINVEMWGGGGGGGAPGGWTYGYAGGGGGYTTGTIAVTPGQVLTVMAGAGGPRGTLGSQTTTNTYGGGGFNCNAAPGTDCQYAGAGGGRSAIRYGGVDLLTAGGGGGGGSTLTTSNDSSGGAGGGTIGFNGAAVNNPTTGGGGGTQAAGGIAGVGGASGASAGTQYTGGHNTTQSYGGGGGGGWYGGGGGAYHNVTVNQMGGGGGGSGYISGAGVSNAITVAGYTTMQANANDQRNGGAGAGGAASTNGVAGRVVITTTTGSSDHGTPTGTTVVNGISGKARRFNGSSDRIDIPVAEGSTLDLDTIPVTIEAWVKTNTTSGIQRIACRGLTSTNGYCLSIGVNGSGKFNLGGVGGGNFDSSTAVVPGQWYYVAGVTNGASSQIYINGVLDSSGTVNVIANSTGTNLLIGAGRNNTDTVYDNFFNGSLDEVRISNVARSAQDIADTYRLGKDEHYIISLPTSDLSTKTTLPFYIAADKPGTYLTTSIGESNYANYQPDSNTLGLWHLEEDNPYWVTTFPSTTIDTTSWTELDPAANKISQSSGLILSAGAAAAWDSGVISKSVYTRQEGLQIYGKFTTSAGVAAPNHMMFGFGQDQSANASYATITHALYFNAGTFQVYQDGTPITGVIGSGYVAGTPYEVRITLNRNGTTARYEVKGGVYTSWTLLLANDSPKTNVNLRAQVAEYQHTGTFNAISVTAPAVIADSSLSEKNASNSGTLSVAGKFGKGRYFALNSSDAISFPSINVGTDYTMESWIQFPIPTNTNWRTIFANNGGTYHYAIVQNAASLLGVYNGGFFSCGYDVATISNGWHHLALTVSSSSSNTQFYLDGFPICQSATKITNQYFGVVGNYSSGSTSQQAIGASMDEVRFSNIARSPTEIRQTYEVGQRSHSVTVDFGAKLDSGNLIASSGDLSFTVDATIFGLGQKGSGIYPGDKIIVRENYDGTEYIAQGTVNSVVGSTGAITVASWDAGGTFPAGGFTVDADVFKWQRDYWNLSNSMYNQRDAVSLMTMRMADGNMGRTVYLDDLRSNNSFMTIPTGSTITSATGSRYFQYRSIFHSSDDAVSANLTSVTLNYNTNTGPTTPTLNSPPNGSTGVSLTPTLQTTSTDPDLDYLRYKIELCTNALMTVGCVTPFDQTTSQASWSGQNVQSNTAYTSGMIASYTISTNSPLANNTTYYWRSYSIDPNGTNTWSSTQTPTSFTTTVFNGGKGATTCKVTRTNNTNVLNWHDTSLNEAGYAVQRNVNNTGWTDLNMSLSANTETLIDSSIAQNTSYQYRIAPYVSGPIYGDWCTISTQSIQTGTINFGGGFNYSGFDIN